ncbi:hypothetical protein GCM10020331_098140 [Ectobacillus funiculus]
MRLIQKQVVQGLDQDTSIPFKLVFKSVVKEADSIRRLVLEANADEKLCRNRHLDAHVLTVQKCGLRVLEHFKKPMLHLHTQFNCDIPWDSIDMDFMNTNQAAHGDREHGFIGTRMNIKRKVVVGHWENTEVRERIGSWMRTAVAVAESKHLKVARFGDNMRQVAVTEGDKIEAQIKFGWTVNGYGVGDLVQRMNDISEQEVDQLFEEYKELYEIVPEGLGEGTVQESIREQARIELGLKAFLKEGNYTAFTTTFEDLHGIRQLPGLAVQRLMAEGYGFAGEGDWKNSSIDTPNEDHRWRGRNLFHGGLYVPF